MASKPTVEDAEGNSIDVDLSDILSQVNTKDVVDEIGSSDLLEEIGLEAVIKHFGEEELFEAVCSNASGWAVKHIGANDLLGEIKIRDAIAYYGEDDLFEQIADPKLAVTHCSAKDLIMEMGEDTALEYIDTRTLEEALGNRLNRVELMRAVLDQLKKSYPGT